MRRVLLALIIIVAVVGAGYFLAQRKSGPSQGDNSTYRNDGKVKISRPKFDNNEPRLENETKEISTKGDPIVNTMEALLATSEEGEGKSAFPKGTKLLSLKVESGVATVDLSKDFKVLSSGGDTARSLAQNSIRKALAQFPSVKKMSVLVEGKLFSDESGEWENISVRDGSPQSEAKS
jgi:germination protein M